MDQLANVILANNKVHTASQRTNVLKVRWPKLVREGSIIMVKEIIIGRDWLTQ